MNNSTKTNAITWAGAIILTSGTVCLAAEIGSHHADKRVKTQIKSLKKTTAVGTHHSSGQKTSKTSPRWVELAPQKKGVIIRTVREHADYNKMTSVAALEANMDLVVVGKPIQDFLDRRHIATYFPDGNLNSAGTEGLIQVQSVLKSRRGQGPIPAILRVVEPAGLIQDGASGNLVKLSPEEYQEMQKGSVYILFLRRNKLGSYSIQNFNLGKFNIDGTDAGDDLDEAYTTQGDNGSPDSKDPYLETGSVMSSEKLLTEKQVMKAELAQRYQGRF